MVASAALALSGALFLAPSALAVHELNLLELDGNAVTNGAQNATTHAPDDWDEVCRAVTATAATPLCTAAGALATSNTAAAWADDGAQNATIFTGGGSKDPLPLSGWASKDQLGGLPDKDNLQHAFAARYSVPKNTTSCKAPATAANCEVLYFGSDRFDNSGDAQQGFWFFQNTVKVDPTTGAFVDSKGNPAQHKDGDLLILSDFSNGGTTSTINIYRWTGSASSGTLTLLNGSASAECGTSTNDVFCGLVNPNNATAAPWPFKDKSGNSSYLNGEFYEGGVNLSDPAINLGGECFSSFAAETRSSTSTTATLKDFVLGQFALCSASMTTTPSADETPSGAVSPGTPVTDTAVVAFKGSTVLPTGNVTFFLCGPIATGNCVAPAGTQVGSPVALAAASPPVAGQVQATSSAVNTSTKALVPGRYCFRASYAGDSNYPDALTETNSAAECFVVRTIPTTTVTTPSDSSGVAIPNPTTTGVPLGTSLFDRAVVTGTAVGGTPTGAVNFFVCNPNQLTSGACAAGTGTAVTGNPKTLSAVASSSPPAAAAVSGAVTGSIAGVWCFRATYVPSGSTYDPSDDTGSTTECVKVNPDSTTTVTTPQVSGSPISGNVAVNTSVTDHAVVTGTAAGGAPAGSVDFYICNPSQVTANGGTCNTGGTATPAQPGKPLSAVTGTNTATADSNAVVADVVGTWCFRAEYKSSTDNYTNSSDSRVSECFTVSDTTGATSAQTWLPNDSATITSVGGTALKGSIAFTLYDSPDCTGTVLRATETVPVDQASPATKSTSNTTVSVGTSKTVSWKVVFTSTNDLVSGSNHCESTQLTITN
ncbi:hypothetical protein GCM10009868_29990 [Terrabacter aerolatus]|uniref:Ig-like domain-containing protein n=1 Tax=Terrabacter aerolatus TaxID=422442 RepID=A0A512D2R1_9MICO|nr:hypothetical protein [Terrabacter aerolatus]GEO30734.1 hypothetical protein TAE01_25440 [Terrabacter aerolatus]